MNNKLNNKGYMLVEIILAAALAMGIVYFITELTIKLKNKNDDLLVKTLVYTDQAIIYNTIMKDLLSPSVNEDYYDYPEEICNYINEESSLNIENNKFSYNGFENIITEYATISGYTCSYDTTTTQTTIKIPISVKQLPDEDFDVIIHYTPKENN